MPTNKNAQLRYKVLDRCFGDCENLYSLEKLTEIVNDKLSEFLIKDVTTRTIKNDIKFMRDSEGYNAPIDCFEMTDEDGERGWFYKYCEDDYSVFKNELSVSEINDLQNVIDMLGRYHGIPAYQWVDDVVSNLKYRFGLKSNTENIVGFDQNVDLKGIEHLSSIIDFIVDKKALIIV